MSRVDALPADQRSVLQLLLKQGKGYDDLSGLLNLHANEVRSRAYDALDAIGPGAAGLPSDRRQAIADWLLGQQGPDEAGTTRAFVAGSPAARAWAEAVAEELRPLGADRLPEVPLDGADGAAPAQATAAAIPSPPAEPAGDAAAPRGAAAPADTPFAPAPTPPPRVSRRGGAILLAALAAAVVAVVLILVLTGKDDNKPQRAANTTTTTSTQPVVKAQVNLTPPKGAPAAKALAIVQVVESNGQKVVNAVAQGLPASSKAAYAIWAYTSPTEARLIGGFDKTDNKGHLVYQGALPQDVTDVTRYKEILVSRETSGNPTKPGTIYLRGPMQAGTGG
jgi:Anti-sigma-K factor rskA, C-terminal